MGEQISVAFDAIARLAGALGVSNLRATLGLWRCEVDADWTIRVNGHAEKIDGVPPYHALVEWRGLPAGLIAPNGGTMVAVGTSSEDTFIAAVRARYKRERAKGAKCRHDFRDGDVCSKCDAVRS